MPRRILVTSALPYANGSIHIGHLVETILTDIWVRFQKLRGHRTIYLCADDTHGTAIMISAEKAGVTETAFIDRVRDEHVRDFSAFEIGFDHYGSTHSEENRVLCHQFWQAIRDAGLVVEREIEQFYDPQRNVFLADRFVQGTCPNCKTPGQNGDSCDKCGATYSPTDLIDPISRYSGVTPVLKQAKHLFVTIEVLREFLIDYVQNGDHVEREVANYLTNQFLKDTLRDWDVSRTAPYFGFEIPDAPGNYWYVWFDAPIGYLASTWQWCKQTGESLDAWWKDDQTEIHHFIGKDITYFHTLFWPAMLKTAGYPLPRKVHIHGFLTVDGEKMSKSKGTLVGAATYARHLDPMALRYFYASKLNSGWGDLDLDRDEFIAKVNTDLVGKVVNLASRTARFLSGMTLSETYPDDGGLFAAGAAVGDSVAAAYEAGDTGRAMRLIMERADAANSYVEQTAPWTLRKDPAQAERLRDVCTVSLNLFRQIVVYLAPVLPRLARQTGELLADPITSWEQSQTPLTGTPVGPFSHMMTRLDPKDYQAMIDESKPSDAASQPGAPAPPAQAGYGSTASPTDSDAASPTPPGVATAAGTDSGVSALGDLTEAQKKALSFGDSDKPLADEPLAAACSIDDFAKVDLRIARVIEAEPVEGADKLLRLTLSLGGTNTRNVFAGIKKAVKPEDILGKLVVMVANLEPRKMRFGLSEGMVTAAGPGGPDVFLLGVAEGAVPGQRVH